MRATTAAHLVTSLGMLLVAACVHAGEAGVPKTGIEGSVTVGPQCPVIGPDTGVECDDRPYQGTVVVRNQDGASEVTRFTAQGDGTFQVTLAPGTYRLVPLPGPNGLPIADQQTIEVVSGELSQVQILFDTGIR